ncbi:S8 family serine peptidase [Flavobacterium sp. CYK-4]|uniref:S8 family peptidase n=1 Tax=Flavobacterium lotistagni TaxID=2709660 RepID=UPI0014075121|nr:S8 family peptidase [Flavobacterium lotistagni]NHM06101.1 S8 family serine peptidase [Flavobacterium lotistagni]
MNLIKTISFSILLSATVSFSMQAQGTSFAAKKGQLTDEQLKRWSHLDLGKDSVPGMSVDRVYSELIKNRKGKKVIVGVIDSGVDIEHEDLKNVLWTNKKEIAGNGVDDDKNGFVDDIHGWNFLGDSGNENLEMTRILKKTDDGSPEYKAAKTEHEKMYQENLQGKQQVDFLFKANQDIKDYLKKDNYTLEEVKAIETTDPSLNRSKQVMISVIGQAGPDFNDGLNDYKNQVYDMLNYNLNKDFDGRKILGDNPDDMTNTHYGNNIVYGPDKKNALHGTHVAGIIAQSRNNNLGGDGIADNAEIMAIRAVPNGDEYDKDIALSIRYAVDNGAKVINGSFGKSFSPHKQWVYDAIKYAEKKDVLIVHAAGNDAKDIDVESNFPNDSDDKKTEFADNMITVGALSYNYGEKIIAPFSNYGKLNVDVYAPGMEIYATTPNNTYKYEQGTSMASPNVAGVAAMIRSYFPNLTAKQVKYILMNSGTAVTDKVIVGGNPDDKKAMTDICKSGKIVNAYNAFKMAEKMSVKSKSKKVRG